MKKDNAGIYTLLLGFLLGAAAALAFLTVTIFPAYGETALDHLCDDTGEDCVAGDDCKHPEEPPDEAGYVLICPPDIWESDWPTELFMPYFQRVEIDMERVEHADYLWVDLWLPYSNAAIYDVLLTDLWTWVHAEICNIGDNGLRLRFAAQSVSIFEEGNWTYLAVIAH